MAREGSTLQVDVLEHISEHIHGLQDLVKFGAVGKSHRQASRDAVRKKKALKRIKLWLTPVIREAFRIRTYVKNIYIPHVFSESVIHESEHMPRKTVQDLIALCVFCRTRTHPTEFTNRLGDTNTGDILWHTDCWRNWGDDHVPHLSGVSARDLCHMLANTYEGAEYDTSMFYLMHRMASAFSDLTNDIRTGKSSSKFPEVPCITKILRQAARGVDNWYGYEGVVDAEFEMVEQLPAEIKHMLILFASLSPNCPLENLLCYMP